MGSGYEIAYTGGLGENLTGKLVVYLDSAPNPMTDEAWKNYVPPPGYSLNTPRTTVFDVLELLGSPFVPTGEYTSLTTSDGYSWISVAALARSIYPYVPITLDGVTLSPQQIAYSLSTPPDGMVIVDSNDKNHVNIHWGINGENGNLAHLQYFVVDPWNNKYILKSVNSKYDTAEKFTNAFEEAVFPLGWTKLAPIYFEQDIKYTPIYSGPNDSLAHANEFRDSADSAWTQIEWGSAGITLNAMTAGGLPIWGGPQGGRLLGNVEDNLIYGGQGNDFIQSLSGNDTVYGGRGADSLVGSGSNDYFDGNDGLDTIIFDDKRADFLVAHAEGGSISIAGESENITLINVERLHFSDWALAFDIDGNAGQAYRLYQAAFARTPDTPGLKYQTNALDTALNLWQVAGDFIASPEFQSRYGSPSTVTVAQFVTMLYHNGLGRDPDQAGYDHHMNNLAGGLTRAQLLVQFSESPENQSNVLPAIQDGIWMG